jgi:hypothetical protein
MLPSVSLLVRNQIVSVPRKIDLDAFPRGCYAYHRLDGVPYRDRSKCSWCVRARRSRNEFAVRNHASG